MTRGAFYEAHEYRFSGIAANAHLPKAAPEHRERGHDYELTIILASKRLDDGGYVVLPSRLGVFDHWIDTVMDGAKLHDLMDDAPTPAAIARFVYDEWWPNPSWGQRLIAVVVRTGEAKAGAYAPHGLSEQWLVSGAATKPG